MDGGRQHQICASRQARPGSWYRATDGFDSSRVGQGKIDEQDAATKINPEHSLLDLNLCLGKVHAGPGMNAFTWWFGCHFLQTHLTLINECIVVALSRGRVAAMHHSNSVPYVGWK